MLTLTVAPGSSVRDSSTVNPLSWWLQRDKLCKDDGLKDNTFRKLNAI